MAIERKEPATEKGSRVSRSDSSSLPATIISVFSLLVSIAAFAVSYCDTEATRRHNRLSVTPVLQFETIRVPYEPRSQVGIYLTNHGTGVARIKGFELYLDGELVSTSDGSGFVEVARKLGLLDRADFPLTLVTGGLLGRAMPPGDSILLFGLDKKDFTADRKAMLDDAISRISARITYRSVYDEVTSQGLNWPPVKPSPTP